MKLLALTVFHLWAVRSIYSQECQKTVFDQHWELVQMSGLDSMPIRMAKPFIIMSKGLDGSVSISGSDGCNRFGSRIEIDSLNIKVDPIRKTKRACMQFEPESKHFLEIIQSVVSYRLRCHTIEFYGDDNKMYLQFKPASLKSK